MRPLRGLQESRVALNISLFPMQNPLVNFLQARTLEWVAISYSNSPTLSDPMGCSLPASSVHGISQARVLEWGSIPFSINI